jgi:hypothetical protein
MDCDTLKALGVTQDEWDRMVDSATNPDSNSTEQGFADWTNGSPVTWDPFCFPDGRLGMSTIIPADRNKSGFSYHWHPPGSNGTNPNPAWPDTFGTHFSDLDSQSMNGWPSGTSLVGTPEGLFMRQNCSDPGVETQVGGDNWWDADCF